MANKMLIDAAHPEETRVVVLRGSRIEEFDFEAASKRQLRGNIYLAKVTRVEPSLQAAFVDYGGNRHGFLAFSEIHPDYYQIPMSDRQALMDEESAEDHDDEDERRPRRSRRRRGGDRQAAARRGSDDETVSEGAGDEHAQAATASAPDDTTSTDDTTPADISRPVQMPASQTPPYDDPSAELIEHAEEVHAKIADAPEAAPGPAVEPAHGHEPTGETQVGMPAKSHVDDDAAPVAAHDTVTTDAAVDTGSADAPASETHPLDAHEGDAHGAHDIEAHDGEAHEASGHEAHAQHDEDDDEEGEDEHVEQLGGDAMEEVPRRAYRPRRQYKIQEVIKRRQVLLVQVVKEERGNKGAAITTYLSLAGRYSVLMPNTARGGGISRKITDAGDRQRLKSIAQDLEVPDGMGVILRTAGASRSKPEVKRDFEYLMRMWETVRETTLQSSAPTLVYEEGSLIKRAIRDLYNKDVEEVIVSGEEGYREAKDFMKLLMPSHTRNVQPWRDPAPIFTKAGAEAQLDAMFSPQVTLKSGGYLVINQTEALVAIDVNSGRSTREHNIEDTAVRTNLEAADEVARQLRLRDLAGLIVVDFIDMEENRNNRAVEKRLKDALKDDRARIQVGRISHFGLLEMSRQRIRTGVLEGSTVVCEHCAGAGTVRSVASIALHVLRLLEDALLSDSSHDAVVRTRSAIALYILNHKRAHLSDLEGRFGVAVVFENDESLTGMTYCALERGEMATGIVRPARQIVTIEEPEAEIVEDEPSEDETPAASAEETHEAEGDGSRKRRRRRGRGRDRESSGIAGDAPQPADDALAFVAEAEALRPAPSEDEGESEEAAEKEGRRRRSRRGGRRSRGQGESNGRDGQSDEVAAQTVDEGALHAVHNDDVAPHAAEGDEGAAHAFDGVEATAEAFDAAIAEPVEQREPSVETTSESGTGSAPIAAEATVDESSTIEPVAAPLPPIPLSVAANGSQPTPEAAAHETAAHEAVIHEAAAHETAVHETAVHEAAAHETAASRRPEPVSTELDPARPKRAGWWSRAKATLGG